MEVLDAVRRKQGPDESDEAFAARLHVSKATWVDTRTGKLPIRWVMACAILEEFGDLTLELLAYMREEARKRRAKDQAAA